MTHDELKAVAERARQEPMVTAHVLTLADGVLALLRELDGTETLFVKASAQLAAAHDRLVATMGARIADLEAQLAALRLELMDRR